MSSLNLLALQNMLFINFCHVGYILRSTSQYPMSWFWNNTGIVGLLSTTTTATTTKNNHRKFDPSPSVAWERP
jgi:hypothetical protein